MQNLFRCVGVGACALLLVAVGGVALAQSNSSIDDVGGSIFDSVSVDLKVNGQDGPITVAAGSRIVVSWISEGASRCRGNWSRNDIKSSGTVAGRLSRSVVIKAACIDKEGNRDDDSVVVNVEGKAQIPTPVSQPTPTTSAQKKINIEPQITADGFSYTGQVGVEFSKMFIADAAVEWDIPNIETKLPPGLSLVKFGAFAGQIKGVPSKSGIYTFDLIARESASNGVGSVSVRITIAAPTPTTISPINVDLKVNGGSGFTDGPVTVAAGTTIALSYTTTGKIEECKGDISGENTASIRTVANATKTYAVTCTQDGGTGTASDTVTVNVTPATTSGTNTNDTTTATAPAALSATAPTIAGTRTAAGDKLYPGSMSITATISNSGGQLTTPISARFQYSPNNGANWYDFMEVGPISTTPRNVSHTWDGGSGSFCFRLALGTGTDNVSPSSCIEIVPTEGAFIGVSREFAAVAVPDNDVWEFVKRWLGR